MTTYTETYETAMERCAAAKTANREAQKRYAVALADVKTANREAQKRYAIASADAQEAHEAYLKAYREYREATQGA